VAAVQEENASRALQLAPTVTLFAGALMGMKDLDEIYLDDQWHNFVAKFPETALCAATICF
jgi:hypothetical protein